MKGEIEKLQINKLVKILTGLNDLNEKVDDLDVGKLKNVPKDFKKVSYVVDQKVDKNTKLSTLNTKVNYLEKKIPDVCTLIQTSQYKTDKRT